MSECVSTYTNNNITANFQITHVPLLLDIFMYPLCRDYGTLRKKMWNTNILLIVTHHMSYIHTQTWESAKWTTKHLTFKVAQVLKGKKRMMIVVLLLQQQNVISKPQRKWVWPLRVLWRATSHITCQLCKYTLKFQEYWSVVIMHFAMQVQR